MIGMGGTWMKASLTKPTMFYDGNGNEVTLTVGQTFIQVIPGDYQISFTPGSDEPPATPAPSPSPSSR